MAEGVEGGRFLCFLEAWAVPLQSSDFSSDLLLIINTQPPPHFQILRYKFSCYRNYLKINIFLKVHMRDMLILMWGPFFFRSLPMFSIFLLLSLASPEFLSSEKLISNQNDNQTLNSSQQGRQKATILLITSTLLSSDLDHKLSCMVFFFLPHQKIF